MMEKVHTNAGIEVGKITEEEYKQIEKENIEEIEGYGWADMCLFCDHLGDDNPIIQFGKFGNKTLYLCSKHDRRVDHCHVCPDFLQR